MSRYPLTPEQKSPAVKTKLDSVLARLERLRSEEDGEDEAREQNEHESRTKLFG